jgi:hypothetical protein
MSGPITSAEVARQVAAIDAMAIADARGKAFEGFTEFLFTSIGCPNQRNVTSPLHSEQVDLAVCHMGALDPLPNFFLVECKYWDDPLTSAGVGYFINTCASRRVRLGIIVAKNGITGDAAAVTYAHSLAYGASARGVNLILLTLDHLNKLTCNEDLVDTLRHSWIRAMATGGIGIL